MSNYKPEEAHYIEMDSHNSSTLINAFVDNNTIEESKETKEEVEIPKTIEQPVEKAKTFSSVAFIINTILVILSMGAFLLSAFNSFDHMLFMIGITLSISSLVSSIVVLIKDNSSLHKVLCIIYIVMIILIFIFMIFMITCVAPTASLCGNIADGCDKTKCPG